MLLWRSREPDKEVGPGKHEERLWKRIGMVCAKVSDTIDEENEETD